MPRAVKARKKPAAGKPSASRAKSGLKRASAPKLPVKKGIRTARRRTPVRRAATPRRKPVFMADEKFLGKVAHYFPKVRAAVIKLKAPVTVGEKIKIKGHTTDFIQEIVSMQIDHSSIKKADKGDVIGLLVNSRVRRRDSVTKV